MPLPKHQEWHIAYDLHPTYNFSTPPVKKMKIRPCSKQGVNANLFWGDSPKNCYNKLTIKLTPLPKYSAIFSTMVSLASADRI